MQPQTMESAAYEMDLIQAADFLPDKTKPQSEERRYRNMTLEEIDAEIAALEAKYGTTPNAKTLAAMKEAEAGLCEKCTLEEAIAEIYCAL